MTCDSYHLNTRSKLSVVATLFMYNATEMMQCRKDFSKANKDLNVCLCLMQQR